MTGQTAAAFFESARFFVRLCASDAAAFAPSTALRCPVTRFVSGFGFSASGTGFVFFVRAVFPFRLFVSGCSDPFPLTALPRRLCFFRVGFSSPKIKIPRTPCDGRTGKPMRIRVVFVPKDKILYRQVYVFFYYTPIFLVCQLKNQIIW